MSASPQASSTAAKPVLVVVDDDPLIVELLLVAFEDEFECYGAGDRRELNALLTQLEAPAEFAIVDLGLPPRPHRPEEGLAAVRDLMASSPQCVVAVVSGQDERAAARLARTVGAVDFVSKPCDPQQIRDVLVSAGRTRGDTGGILGESPLILRLREQISQFAPSPFPVLVEGETGTGKELIARALHDSARAGKPFLALNCAAISPHLVESTLFGHRKGAFTGADADVDGYFHDALDGTLFLDEIGEMPSDIQPKLLRVLETGEYQRVGETVSRAASARIIAATNRDLGLDARQKRFRDDLYHRLSVLSIRAPALRDAGDDRILLLRRFREEIANQLDSEAFRLAADATERWSDYQFPGNVRELRNIVIRLQTKHPGAEVGAAALEDELYPGAAPDSSVKTPEVLELQGKISDWARERLKAGETVDLGARTREFRHLLAVAALEASDGDRDRAAAKLGVTREEINGMID